MHRTTDRTRIAGGLAASAVAVAGALALATTVAAALGTAVALPAGGLLLDGEGGIGVGANLGDATWLPLGFLALWAVPLGVLGAAVGRAITRPSRPEPAEPIPTA